MIFTSESLDTRNITTPHTPLQLRTDSTTRMPALSKPKQGTLTVTITLVL